MVFDPLTETLRLEPKSGAVSEESAGPPVSSKIVGSGTLSKALFLLDFYPASELSRRDADDQVVSKSSSFSEASFTRESANFVAVDGAAAGRARAGLISELPPADSFATKQTFRSDVAMDEVVMMLSSAASTDDILRKFSTVNNRAEEMLLGLDLLDHLLCSAASYDTVHDTVWCILQSMSQAIGGRCPDGHVLLDQTVPTPTNCAECERGLLRGAEVTGCRRCDLWLCNLCATKTFTRKRGVMNCVCHANPALPRRHMLEKLSPQSRSGRTVRKSMHKMWNTVLSLVQQAPASSPLQLLCARCLLFEYDDEDLEFLYASGIAQLFAGTCQELVDMDKTAEDGNHPALAAAHTEAVHLDSSTLTEVSGSDVDSDQSACRVTVDQMFEINIAESFKVSASSNSQLVNKLTDSNTDGFWESDGNTSQSNQITIEATAVESGITPQIAMVAIYVDNARDNRNQIAKIKVLSGSTEASLNEIGTVDVAKFRVGWVTLRPATGTLRGVVRIKLVAWPQMQSVRVRQLKLFQVSPAKAAQGGSKIKSSSWMELSQCARRMRCLDHLMSLLEHLVKSVFGIRLGSNSASSSAEARCEQDDADARARVNARRQLYPGFIELRMQVLTAIIALVKAPSLNSCSGYSELL